MQPFLDNMKQIRDKTMEFFTTSNPIVVAQSLVQIIQNTQDQMKNECLEVDKEVQFNEWLFGSLNKMLASQGFVFRIKKQNKDILPNICEYSTSQPGCVVYHANSVTKDKIVALAVQIDSDESSNSNVNIEDIEGIKLTQSTGCAVEV